MPRKGENIYLRKDGRWEGRYIKGRRPDGKIKFGSIYGKQYSDVKKRLVLIKSELYRDRTTLVIYGNGSLHDWAEYWLEALIRPYVKPNTWAGYRRNLNKHIYPSLGEFNIQSITSDQIQNTVDGLKSRLAASTLHGVCRLLKSILSAAFRKEIISRNPYQDIKLPRVKTRPPRVLTQSEQVKLEKEVLKTGDLEHLLCLYTGLRVGELCALRWEDIDFENHSLRVTRSAHRIPMERGIRKTRLVLGTPKSGSSIREIPLPLFLISMLQEKLSKEGLGNGFLFKGAKEGFQDFRTLQQKIHRICKQLGIYGVHMHTLRHTFATRCLEKGVQYEVLCELLGHSSPQITLRHYAHCTLQTKRESINRLGSIVV